MSRGPTRRVQRLITSGAISDELLRASDHEADLAGHPYIDIEHVELGRLHLAGRLSELAQLRALVNVPVSHHWWKPLGPHSAFRPRGLAETRARCTVAEGKEHGTNDSPGKS